MNSRNNISDFSSKNSKAYEDNMRLFAEAGDKSSNLFEDLSGRPFYKSPIPTRLREKTHNSPNFLDEDYQSKRKMRADTSALEEFTGIRSKGHKSALNEMLMYGSTEDDLDEEITEGGVATEIAEILEKHGITGEMVHKTFNKLEKFYGSNPDVRELVNGGDEEEDEETSDEDENEDSSAMTEEAIEAGTPPEGDVDEIDVSNDSTLQEATLENLTEKLHYLDMQHKKKVITNKLKEKYMRTQRNGKKPLREALLVSPVGEGYSKVPSKDYVVGLEDTSYDDVCELTEFQKEILLEQAYYALSNQNPQGIEDTLDWVLNRDDTFIDCQDCATEYFENLINLGLEEVTNLLREKGWIDEEEDPEDLF